MITASEEGDSLTRRRDEKEQKMRAVTWNHYFTCQGDEWPDYSTSATTDHTLNREESQLQGFFLLFFIWVSLTQNDALPSSSLCYFCLFQLHSLTYSISSITSLQVKKLKKGENVFEQEEETNKKQKMVQPLILVSSPVFFQFSQLPAKTEVMTDERWSPIPSWIPKANG